MWRHLRLRQLGGHKFRRQQPLGPYIVDFVCLEKRLIVEVDGGHHTAQVAKDAQRAACLEAEGFRLLRFWNTEVLQETEAVWETIRAALDDESPPPQSSPARGEEEGYPACAWNLDFVVGLVLVGDRSSFILVRAVRGGS